MSVQVEFHVAGVPVRQLPDPSGGSFDAAGDFDRLLPYDDPEFPLLTWVQSERELRLGPADMTQLIEEVDRLLTVAQDGPESRGLLRLRTMASRCAEQGGQLLFIVWR